MKYVGRDEFKETYCYHGEDLGCIKENKTYKFMVFSPLSEKVYVCIYDEWNIDDKKLYSMNLKDNGVWERIIHEELEGKYYTFVAIIDGEFREGIDPYCKAVSINGEKGAIIDFNKTNPYGWNNHKRPMFSRITDAIIYEIHIRDVSIDVYSGIENKGKFLGFTEDNTRGYDYTKTGLSHIKDLGITHVQLLPIYDFGSIDEKSAHKENTYNWGYDPVNYNTPDGSYSTNPYNPYSRIFELKSAIKALHENGIGVIMDVVYNHIYDVEKSSFNTLAPGYFFRKNEDGSFANESGCGNAMASEKPMVRKFIVDSVKYWAREYKLDGFRFDLMGLIDVRTMNEIRDELVRINPNIIIIGEGWNMGWTLQESEKSIQGNAYKLRSIGFFNDDIRDALKGSNFDIYDRGFINGKEHMETRIKKGIVGAVKYSEEIQTWGEVEPNQVVNYVECHDNNTLWDKLKISNEGEEEEDIKAMHRLASTIILTSQGIPFIHAGQEFFRSKEGVENSYNAGDHINKLDWKKKSENMDTVNYFKGLIKLRKEHPAFRITSSEEIRAHVEFIYSPQNVVAYCIKDYANGDVWNKIIVIHNSNNFDVEFDLPYDCNWYVVVDKEKSGIESIKYFIGNKVIVKSLSSMVIHD